jgi:lysozyme family protein
VPTENPSIFTYCLVQVLEWEGGYVDSVEDPGGRTAHGISETHHPEAWVDGVPTKEDAALIYKKDYWEPYRCGDLPPMLALPVFDAAVNQGRKAGTFLQLALAQPHIAVDGIIGERTLLAARMHTDKRQLLRDFTTYRIKHYSELRHFQHYWKGWIRRAIDMTIKASVFDDR